MMHYKKLTGVGIVGYGAYVPRLRISVAEIAAARGVDAGQVETSLRVKEKAVANWDEDTATMAYMAAYRALQRAGIAPDRIGAVYVGSESHPYAVKPTSTIIAEALGVGNAYMAADLEFACKAGTAALQIVASQVLSGVISYGLAVGADCAQAKLGDVLEYTSGAGSAAFILGKRKVLARLVGFYSYSSDTNDFWRRRGRKTPVHAGRFTGEPAYFRHVEEATKGFLEASGTTASDYDYVVFHMPNGKFPRRVAKRLGFEEKQLTPSLVVSQIGNPYSASSLIGLCRVLEKAGSGKRILITSYGSGSGSDALAFVTTKQLVKSRKNGFFRGEKSLLRNLTYGEYRVLLE